IRSLIGASQQSIHRNFNLDIPQQISYDKWFELLHDIISKIDDDILREKYKFLSINRHEIHDMITRIIKDVIKNSSESETRLVPNYALLSSAYPIKTGKDRLNIKQLSFCFTGTHGQLAIHLSNKIKVVSITYEHLNPTMALDPDDMRRAPKTFEIVGISVDSQEKYDEYFQLGSFDYKLDGPPAQIMKAVILKIMGNWGDDELTCLYQVK
ncbi:23233_t:CDS:2, partial [Gigaspora rosea]